MAKKPEASADEGKGLTLADAVRLGRTRELFFVAGIAKGGTAALVADPRKGGMALFNRAKDQNEGMSRAKSVTGVLTVSGKELDLRLEDAEIPGPLRKAMKKMLKEAGMPMKIVFRLPDGQTEEEAEGDEAEAQGGDGGDEAADPLAQVRETALAQVAAFAGDLDRVLAQGAAGAARKGAQLKSMFDEAVAGPDPARALPIAKLLSGFVATETAKIAKAAGDTASEAIGGMSSALGDIAAGAQAALGTAGAGLGAGLSQAAAAMSKVADGAQQALSTGGAALSDTGTGLFDRMTGAMGDIAAAAQDAIDQAGDAAGSGLSQMSDALAGIAAGAQSALEGVTEGVEAGLQGLADAGKALTGGTGAGDPDAGAPAAGPPGTGEAPPDAGRPSTGAPGMAEDVPLGAPSVPQAPDAGAAAPDPAKLSGKTWWNANQAKYPNSTKVEDLSSTFKPKAEKFIAALKAAGASTRFTATLRSRARADLMYYCWQVGKMGMDAATVPAIDGVDIIWDHGDAEKSKKGALEMHDAFEIAGVVAKPGNSNHLTGNAMDMYISWTGTLKIKNASDEEVTIEGAPTDETNEKIQEVGATYGCKNGAKTLDEPWHWSPTGK